MSYRNSKVRKTDKNSYKREHEPEEEKLETGYALVIGNLKVGLNWNNPDYVVQFERGLQNAARNQGWEMDSNICQIAVKSGKSLTAMFEKEEVKRILAKKRTVFCIYYVEGMSPEAAAEMIKVGQAKIQSTCQSIFVMPQGKLTASGIKMTQEALKIRSAMAGVLYGFQGETIDISNRYNLIQVSNRKKQESMWFLHEIIDQIQEIIPQPNSIGSFPCVSGFIFGLDDEDESD